MYPQQIHDQGMRIAAGREKSPSEIRAEVEKNLRDEVASLSDALNQQKDKTNFLLSKVHDLQVEIRVLRSLL